VKRIAILQFHRDVAILRNRVRLVEAFNPGMDVYAVYGGRESLFPMFHAAVRDLLGTSLRHVYCIRGKSQLWKRTHTDLALRLWFHDVGHAVEFDSAVLLQWDLVLFDSIDRLYAHVPSDVVGLTGLTPLRQIAEGWPWTSYPSWRREWEELLREVERSYGYRGEPYACLGPGASFPRAFLDEYARIELPETCHDEVRVPLFAQILGFGLADTQLYRRWFDPEEDRVFNADEEEIDLATILAHLGDPEGRRAFHPFRHVFRRDRACRAALSPAIAEVICARHQMDRLESWASGGLTAARLPHRLWKSLEARARRRTGRQGWPH
jgi:hypothetical protein